MDIQQGNMIEQEVIDQLRPGMNKRQVLYIMGSPILVDVFHQQRWEFIHSEQIEGEARLQKKVTLLFNGDNLAGVQGDFRPSSKQVERISHETTLELPRRELDKTIWEKISGLFGADEPADTETDAGNNKSTHQSNDPLTSSSEPVR